jgi:hypothetical protein
MSKKITAIAAGLGLVALVTAAVVAIQVTAGDASAQGGPAVRGSGTATYSVEPDAGTPLTDDEAAGLAYMREEEKLAQDVYARLADQYDARVFANIARSETQHMQTVKSYLDAFELADPAAGRAAGSFENDELQTLYEGLLSQGATSWEEAVAVGIAIERRDIADLEARIAATDRTDLTAMYENLLRASENHLDAFTRQLDGTAGGADGRGGGAGYGQGAGRGYGEGTASCLD